MSWSQMPLESLRRLASPALFSLIFVASCTGGDAEPLHMAAAPETTDPTAPGAPASRSASADDAICNAPASTVLTPIPPGGSGPAPINVKVHYNRPDGQYAGWGLHVWQINDASQFIGDYPGVTFPQPLMPAGSDAYGPFFQIEASKFTAMGAAGFGFIVHQGDTKDPDGDRLWKFTDGAEFWLRSADPVVYRTNPLGGPEPFELNAGAANASGDSRPIPRRGRHRADAIRCPEHGTRLHGGSDMFDVAVRRHRPASGSAGVPTEMTVPLTT